MWLHYICPSMCVYLSALGHFARSYVCLLVAMCSATLLSGLQGILKVWNHTENYIKPVPFNYLRELIYQIPMELDKMA